MTSGSVIASPAGLSVARKPLSARGPPLEWPFLDVVDNREPAHGPISGEAGAGSAELVDDVCGHDLGAAGDIATRRSHASAIAATRSTRSATSWWVGLSS
jgi:hypothetical protein